MGTMPQAFEPRVPDAAGVVSWVHIGDLHMTNAGEQNHLDLVAIVDEIDRVFADSISFVYLPGDVADQGAPDQYRVVRSALDVLSVPWCSILGDHDVHMKSFEPYLAAMSNATRYTFTVGSVLFIAMNAFDVPEPPSFTVLPDQIQWLEKNLLSARERGLEAVLLLHCYPSDLKRGGQEVSTLVRSSPVHLIEMGHTHYNEVANDGHTLYIATRSTGQIEEGPVGFSVTNIDRSVVSWKFFPLDSLPAVMITSPADERLITDPHLQGHVVSGDFTVHAKVWSGSAVQSVVATWQGKSCPLQQVKGSRVWAGSLSRIGLQDGVYDLTVHAQDAQGSKSADAIRVVVGAKAYSAPRRLPRDQDNAVPAWPERGLLGTQLGPNKNGRKW